MNTIAEENAMMRYLGVLPEQLQELYRKIFVPSVYPFVYGQSKALRIYLDQFPSIVRHESNSLRPLAWVERIKNFNGMLLERSNS